MSPSSAAPVVLTIAGSDSSGGAGVQADLKTFHRFGTFGTAVLTLITAQNSTGVHRLQLLSPALIRAQLEAVTSDLPVAALKTGALGSAEIIGAVADALEALQLRPLVVDPVMISKHGVPLLTAAATEALKERLLPLATVLTPNLHEAAALTGQPIASVEDMERAAWKLVGLGARAVVLKGGALQGDVAVDIVCDGLQLRRLTRPRLVTRNTQGTGCAFSAAITALLAQGISLADSVDQARDFIQRAIAQAPNHGAEQGAGPINFFA
jgi:hydroxymethylpyrimidine/phosphomethylpyrimidine kinase